LLLVGVLLAAGALALYLVSVGQNVGAAERAAAGRAELRAELRRVAGALAENESPQADSRLDTVWTVIDEGASAGVTVTLEDISSKLNPNWMRTLLLKRTSLAEELLIAGASPEAVRDFRNESGFMLDIERAYGHLFTPEALERYFTAYSYANVNVSYEMVLRDLYEVRTGSAGGADVFLSEIRSLLERQELLDAGGFQELVGSDFQTLFPMMNTEPLLNVHFAPELLIEEIVAYPYGTEQIENHQAVAQSLLAERDVAEISPADLRALIPTEGAQERVFQYLGTRTWFWRVTVTNASLELRAILARIPLEEGSGEDGLSSQAPTYRTISEQWSE